MLAIVGSRHFDDKEYLYEIMEEIKSHGALDGVTGFVSGGARGADTFGLEWATKNGLDTHVLKPDWQKYGKGAGVIRNTDIVKMANLIVAFPKADPSESRGTYDTIIKAHQMNKPVLIFDGWDEQ